MFRTLRSIAAAATLTLALTACSSAEDDPVAGVPAFPLDAPSVTLVNPGENPEEVRYSPGEEWDTAVAVVTPAERDPDGPMSVVGVGRIAGEAAALEEATLTDKAALLLSLLAGVNVALMVLSLIHI